MKHNYFKYYTKLLIFIFMLLAGRIYSAELTSDVESFFKEVPTSQGSTLYMDMKNADIEIIGEKTDKISVQLEIEISDLESDLREEFFNETELILDKMEKLLGIRAE